MAFGAYASLRRLQRQGRLDIIDAHFAYPDGYAASLLSRWMGVPFTITLRGTETQHVTDPQFSGRLLEAINRADQVFAVSESLRQLMIAHGANREKIEVVGNGVDTTRFAPQEKTACRQALDIPTHAKVLISVGGLMPPRPSSAAWSPPRAANCPRRELQPGIDVQMPSTKRCCRRGPRA